MPLETEPEVNKEELLELQRRLLYSIKTQQIKKAYLLLDEKLDVNYSDEVGCTALHYAALGGYTDMIVRLIGKSANTKQVDVNGETPVHKATRKGWKDVVIALVAYGADINILNNTGQSALELSVINKDVSMLKLLCKFGAEACLQDWDWTMKSTFGKNDFVMMELLVAQSSRYSGYKYGGISYEVVHMKGKAKIPVTSLNTTVEAINTLDSYYLFCCKMQQQYSDIKNRLHDYENLFSDVYEFSAFDGKSRILQLQIRIPGSATCNERLSVFGLVGNVRGETKFDTTSEDDDSLYTGHTTVYTTFMPGKNGVAQLAIIVTEKLETFAVSDEAVCIQPTVEPEAEIDIPKDTFNTPGQLQISISETKVLNNESEEDLEEPVLVTNVLDMSMSDGQQPHNTIRMTMPVHTPTDADIVVFACHQEYPEDIDDWGVYEVNKSHGGKFVAFDINHFSFFVVGSLKYAEEAKKLATQAIEQKRSVELFGMIKWEIGENITIIFECALKRNGRKRRKKWREKGFHPLPDEYHGCIVPVFQKFQIKLSENLLIQDQQDNKRSIIFNPKVKRQYTTFDLPATNKNPSGTLIVEKCIEREIAPEENAVNIVRPTAWIFCGLWSNSNQSVADTSNLPIVDKYDYELIKVFRVSTELPKVTDPIRQENRLATDPDNNLKVLSLSSLRNLAARLTDRQCFRLGIHLNMQISTLRELKGKDNFKMKMFEKWRPKILDEGLIDILETGLQRIDKQLEADKIHEAFLKGIDFEIRED